MTQTMLSVGIDIGTSTTQLVISKLTIRNTAAAFTVPKLSITEKEIIYRSEIHFTPLLSDTEIDAEAIKKIVDAEYRKSGIDPSSIETGAVIITGETARKKNARQVLDALSGYAGDFVVATAGPDLEGILAAKGAGCDVYSKEQRCAVLNFDIGGGTSNFCLFQNGEQVDTGCLNVGGRLIKLTKSGEITYLSPVLNGKCKLSLGQRVTETDLLPVVNLLVTALEEAAGLRPRSEICSHFTTNKLIDLPQAPITFSFSGGVSDMIYTTSPPNWLAFGDIGVLLGQAIRNSLLFSAAHITPQETIRATVVGAGSHTTTLSGSTIAYEGVDFPFKNVPVLALSDEEISLPSDHLAQAVQKKLHWFWEGNAPSPVVLAFQGWCSPSFERVNALSFGLCEGLKPLRTAQMPMLIAVAEDMGKALGQAMLCQLPEPRQLICIDGVSLSTGAYLDIGHPVSSALPVVIKTLLFSDS